MNYVYGDFNCDPLSAHFSGQHEKCGFWCHAKRAARKVGKAAKRVAKVGAGVGAGMLLAPVVAPVAAAAGVTSAVGVGLATSATVAAGKKVGKKALRIRDKKKSVGERAKDAAVNKGISSGLHAMIGV